jgi:glycosyltransferase involved in cell wall biosynthesis
MIIGIDAAFLAKPQTGIGGVTRALFSEWAESEAAKYHHFRLFAPVASLRAPGDHFPLDTHPTFFYSRDDLIRQFLYERYDLPRRATREGCGAFLSLAQSALVLSADIPHVMIVHDIIPSLFPEYLPSWRRRAYQKQVEAGIGNATRIIAVSEKTKDDLVTKLGVPAEKIVVAYPGIAPVFDAVAGDGDVNRVLSRYGLERGYLYHGGGLEKRKNVKTVLAAYAKLIERENESVPPLVISGKVYAQRNPFASDVRGLIDSFGLGDHVRLLGAVPLADLPALYRGASLFLYPSLYEGFGLPPLEAMSQETPVIASDAASLPEVLGDAVEYVAAHDAEGLADRIRALLPDVARRRALGEHGLNQARRYSRAAFAKAVLTAVETMEK